MLCALGQTHLEGGAEDVGHRHEEHIPQQQPKQRGPDAALAAGQGGRRHRGAASVVTRHCRWCNWQVPALPSCQQGVPPPADRPARLVGAPHLCTPCHSPPSALA